MFGQFLLEQGLIDENAVREALDFQKRSRPSFEILVRAHGLIPDADILDILTLARAENRPFEDLATERGLLSPREVQSLKKKFTDYHLPLGEILVLLGRLNRPQMEGKLVEYWEREGGDASLTHPSFPRNRPREKLETLCKLFREVGASKNRSDTLKRVLNACRESIPCDCGFLATVDKEKNIKIQEIWETRERVPGLEDATDKVEDLERNHTTGIYRFVAATGTPYRAGDVEANGDKYYMAGWKGVRSNLTVPILDPRQHVVGVLVLESARQNAFSAEDQAFLEVLAAYSAMAMEHAGQSERRAKEGRILWNFGDCLRKADQGLVSTEGTINVLEQVLDLCLDEVQANQGFVALLNPGHDALDIAIIKGKKAIPASRRPGAIRLGEGITGTAAATKKPVRVDDVAEAPDYIPIFEDMQSELAVPLLYLDQVIGVINVESSQKNAFSTEHEAYCARLASTFAPLVQSAQFFDYTRDRFGVGIQLVGRSLAMTRLKEILVKAARSEAAILLFGDSGTGKEYIAKHIHFNSRRRNGPFEVISCTNTQPELVESELFGHVTGAFTGAMADKIGLFELADGGTVLLDEIGDLPLDLQGKLLRVLQEGTYRRIGDIETRRVNVRVISATNKNLKAMVEDGSFRQDLFFRLDQVRVHIPPLQKRREDILLLTDHFVRKYAEIEQREVKGLSEDALGMLWRHDWPGNVRELEYFVYKLLIFTEEPVIQGEDVSRVAGMFEMSFPDKIPTKLPDDVLRHEIEMALNATRTENRLFKARATRYLGWDKNTLAQKIKALGVEED